jgi:pimeloyl-ACP methyl ester carboxylesterase
MSFFQSDLPLDQLKARWAPPPSRFIELQGMQVHLRDEGVQADPVPIVLVHGTSASLHTWEGWVAALKSERRVITMDIPGFGLTGPEPVGNYHIDRYTHFILGLMDKLGVKHFVLGGNSLGGEIAWHVAAAAPQRVEQLILVDAAGFKRLPTGLPLGFGLALASTKLGLGGLVSRVLPRSVVNASTRFVYGDPRRITPQVAQRYFDLQLRAGNRRALGQRLAQHNMGRDVDQLARIVMPTLIIWGARDRIFSLAQGQGLHRAIRGSELVVFDDLGHVPHEEDADRTVAVVRRFLGLPSEAEQPQRRAA